MVEGIWPKVQLLMNVSDVYERVEQLPDSAESIMEMFASFGKLLVDGTLGRCQYSPGVGNSEPVIPFE